MSAADIEAKTAEVLAPLRRELIAEALDGMVWQAGGAIHFLERGEDAAAERAIARVFDFARTAAAKMKELRGPRPIDVAGASAPATASPPEEGVGERIEVDVVSTTSTKEDVTTSSPIDGQIEGFAKPSTPPADEVRE